MSLESLDDYPTRSVPNIFIALATLGMQVPIETTEAEKGTNMEQISYHTSM